MADDCSLEALAMIYPIVLYTIFPALQTKSVSY